MDLRFTLMAELPNKNLHKFRGKLVLHAPDASGSAHSAAADNGGCWGSSACWGAQRPLCPYGGAGAARLRWRAVTPIALLACPLLAPSLQATEPPGQRRAR